MDEDRGGEGGVVSTAIVRGITPRTTKTAGILAAAIETTVL